MKSSTGATHIISRTGGEIISYGSTKKEIDELCKELQKMKNKL
jgi:hypothetical protein